MICKQINPPLDNKEQSSKMLFTNRLGLSNNLANKVSTMALICVLALIAIGFFKKYFYTIGGFFLILCFIQKFVLRTCRKWKLSVFIILRFIFNANITTIIIIVILSTIKLEELAFQDVSWDSMAAPVYFFMTEFLLISIVSFVVLVNCFIQICCNQSKRSRNLNLNHQLNAIQNNLQAAAQQSAQFNDRSSNSSIDGMSMISGASRQSTTGYSSEGLLILFLLLRNITQLSELKKESGQEDANIVNNRGELILLYLFGIIALTIAFFDQLKDGAPQNPNPNDQRDSQNEVNENELYQQELEKIMADPEVNKVPKFFMKISNSYFMSAHKYTDYLKSFLFKKRRRINTTQITTEINQKNNNTNTKITNERITKQDETIKADKLNKKNELTPNSGSKKPSKKILAQKRLATEEYFDELFFKKAEKDILSTTKKQRNTFRETNKLPQYLQSYEDVPNEVESLKSSIQNVDCMICFSAQSDSVISPCGHGGVCFECCQRIIQDVVKKNQFTSFKNQKIYNFRCHLCRIIGLKVYQLNFNQIKEKQFKCKKGSIKQQDKYLIAQKQLCIPVKCLIDLRLNPLICINLGPEDSKNVSVEFQHYQSIEECKSAQDIHEYDELNFTQNPENRINQYIFQNAQSENDEMAFEIRDNNLEDTSKFSQTKDIGFKYYQNQHYQVNINAHGIKNSLEESGKISLQFELPDDIEEELDLSQQIYHKDKYFKDETLRVNLKDTLMNDSQLDDLI
ncbi:UNKNOWN [Stylonychia lemnae]|uniref:RING-type domain-containing protein n=1 Tax=Stylonychia lemnae TaxID=5949 RepID=A0A077ZZJ3_STYLE|nr:UNKNOWN [Stylonychia lemnae]|eukprot:CDW74658.1 UNKNOWN [Stylonychia lemnae]